MQDVVRWQDVRSWRARHRDSQRIAAASLAIDPLSAEHARRPGDGEIPPRPSETTDSLSFAASRGSLPPGQHYAGPVVDLLDVLPTALARGYVKGMFAFTERALCAVCLVDPAARAELVGLPDGFTLEMKVLPSGPALAIRKDGDRLRAEDGGSRPTLSIQFKHLRHALRMLTFVDDVPRCVATERLVIDGELGLAMCIQRIVGRLTEILIPRALSQALATARLILAAALSRRT